MQKKTNFSLQPPALGVQGRLRRDENNIVDSTDAYAQVEADVALRWRVIGGVRVSRVEFSGSDRYPANGDDSGSLAFSATNPTIGVVFRPDAASSIYASYGRGFETPTLNELAYRPDGSAGFNSALQPARSHNFEIGAKALISPTLRATVALFAINTEDEIVVNGVVTLNVRNPQAALRKMPKDLVLEARSQFGGAEGYYLIKIRGRPPAPAPAPG